MDRTQQPHIESDLSRKMVFLTGPRQVGKTYLAKQLLASAPKGLYLNYDHFEDRAIIAKAAWRPDTTLLVLDELHKMPGWKNFLKGLYDTKPPHLRLLVTGSARLETFRGTGDSLAGRYFRHRLNPLTPAELGEAATDETLHRLMTRGGFPEPYLAEADQDADRWRMQYVDGLVREDVLTLERIQDLRTMQLLLSLLRERVGSPLSLSSLAEDLHCAPNTIKKYLDILEALFIIFRIAPHHHNIARSILKEPKVYFFDTGMVRGDEGVRFENLVAVSLLKHANAIEDYEGRPARLCYLRTKEGKEVDFALVEEGRTPTIIEAKFAKDEVSPALAYFRGKYGFHAVQVVRHLRQERMAGAVEVRRALDFLKELAL